jgi:predicted RNA binding protein YcfA (HicA-like mRNA interferase family)
MPKIVLFFSNHQGPAAAWVCFVSQKGSDVKYRKAGNPTLTVIIPAERKQIPVGTFNSILRQSALVKDDFEK